MNRSLRRWIPLLILLTSCTSQNATTEITSDAWRADLSYLATELSSRHANAFHNISRESFAGEVASLDAAIPRLNRDEILVRLIALVALIGDGHTHLDLPHSFLRYPVELQWFGDDLRVVAAAAPFHSAVGARVLAIGSTPIHDVIERAKQLVPRGENDGRTLLTATMQLTAPAVLRGLGLIADRSNAAFAMELVTGERATITLSPSPFGDLSGWRMVAGENPPLYLQRLTEPWWTEFLPDTQTVYFSFNRYPPDAEFRERAAALGKLLDDSRARRLVIDVRRNQGGDLEQFRRLLLPIIQSRAAINRKGGLFVLTGSGTFSAATVNALDLRNEANAILVGAPTGMRPNHYGEHAEFRLPNSGFRISYATRYYRFGNETDSAVVPDQTIEPTWEDFRAGRDPVMEWIVSKTN